jgi:hypothetical protein
VGSPPQWWRKYWLFVFTVVMVATFWGIGLATLHGNGSSVERLLHLFALSIGVVSVFAAARHIWATPRRPLVSSSYLCIAVGMGALFIWTGDPAGPSYLAWIANAAILASLVLNRRQSSRTRRGSTQPIG